MLTNNYQYSAARILFLKRCKAAAQQAELEICDVQGRRVVPLADVWYPAGRHAVPWDGRDEMETPVAAGVCRVHLRAGDQFSAQRMLLLRSPALFTNTYIIDLMC